MYDDATPFDICSVDFREPVTVEEVLHVAEFEDSAWLAFFDSAFAFDAATPEERRQLILDPVGLGLRLLSIPDEPLRDACQSVRELIGETVSTKLLLRLPTIEAV